MPKFLIQYTPELLEHLKSTNWNQRQFEDIIEKARAFFPELGDWGILVYCTRCVEIFNSVIATMFPLSYPNSSVAEYEDLSSICKLNSNFHFAIYIRRDIFDLDEIAQIINIGHEFHHVSQYIKDKRIYLFGCIVRYFLNDIIPEVRSPVEYDAERKSKIVAYETFGRKKVDEWIASNIPKIRHIFFEVFRDIDVDVYYDLTAEVLRLWKEHGIEDAIAKLRILENRNDDEERIIEMYEYAISTCSN